MFNNLYRHEHIRHRKERGKEKPLLFGKSDLKDDKQANHYDSEYSKAEEKDEWDANLCGNEYKKNCQHFGVNCETANKTLNHVIMKYIFFFSFLFHFCAETCAFAGNTGDILECQLKL